MAVCVDIRAPSIVRLFSHRFVRTFRHWFRGLTGVTATTALLSLAPKAPHPRPLHFLGPVLFELAIHPVVTEARRQAPHPGRIDLSSLFIGGGLCAGLAPIVCCFLAPQVAGLHHIGLEVNQDKTEVIPACTSSQCCGHVTSLGALAMGPRVSAMGFSAWCESLLRRCVAETKALLDTISRFPDTPGDSVFFGLARAGGCHHSWTGHLRRVQCPLPNNDVCQR